MGFLDELKSAAKSGSDEVKKTVRIGELNVEISDLKKKETEAFATIGKVAVALDGAHKFGENGEKLLEIQKQIDEKRAELEQLEPQGNKCPKCGASYTQDMKFCPKCGEKLSE
ncbi:MAG: zinc ribbon domain-containing protein [Methanocorpusculum sp.]|nr:zinc ribbon domain-containing protein [Methanocorpusculum sp.]